MRGLEERLQERFEQLETGASLEACLADLPEDEAELLKLASALGAVQYPERDSSIVAAQRARLLRLAEEENRMKAQPSQKVQKALALSLRNWLRPLAAFTGVAAVLLICALIAAMGTGIIKRSPRDTQVAQGPALDPTLKVSATPSPLPDPTPIMIAQSPIVAPTLASDHSIYMPMVSAPGHPQRATLQDIRGLVQVQASDSTWTTVSAARTITAGQRIRTGELSSAWLVFYDGSQAHLGPDTEIAVDELDARSDGPRVVALTQWIGQTDHDVVPASHASSRYEVRTPSATGRARGTSFHVLVTSDLLARFSVDQGSVAVTNLNATVVVLAGQVTTVSADQAPSEPVFRITGEGRVTQTSASSVEPTGPTWVIAGQTFLTHDGTLIVGNPQVGDWVFVEGRLLPDDTRVADWILLLHRSPANRFTITGRVDAIGDTEWTVAGQTIVLDDETAIEDAIEVGDLVRVEGIILEAGTLLAEHIRLIEEEPGLPFDFTGVVQDIADETWKISGVAISVDADTEIDEGLVVGDVVRVSGWIMEDGTWLARAIERVAEEEPEFEFTGSVESIDPWIVAGIPFETDEWTEVEAGIGIGDRVRVRGRVLEDGTWLATEIERLDDDDEALRIVFVGTVDSIDPWVVNGIPLAVGDETLIEGDVGVGDLVRVEVRILLDGTWQVAKITLISDGEVGLGCLYISAVVVGVNGRQIELSNWPTIFLDDDIPVEGEITVGSVVLLLVCVDADGTIHIVEIIVIYQPAPVIVPPPPSPLPTSPPQPPQPPPPDEGDRVTICHRPPGNPNAAHTITISRSALQEHLDHGDTLGPCPNDNGDDDHDDDHDDDD